MRHISHLTLALTVAAFTTACGGGTSAVNMSEERAQGSLRGNTSPSMELIGCVAPAVKKAEGSFILEHITMPPDEIVPENSNASARIPRGSWVRLGGPDMQKYISKQVLVSGNIVDTPAGTAGSQEAPKPGDYVEWNKTPADTPLFAVERVKEQGECEAK